MIKTRKKISKPGILFVIFYIVLVFYHYIYALNCVDFLCGLSLSIVLLGPWVIFINELTKLNAGWLIVILIGIFNAMILYFTGALIGNIYMRVIRRKTS